MNFNPRIYFVILSFILFGLSLVTSINSINSQNVTTNSSAIQTFTRESHSDVIAKTPFTIYAGKIRQFPFFVPSEAINANLRGTMSIRGGIFSTLDIAVTDSLGSVQYKNTFNGYGSVNILLPPGQTYYLTIRNGAILANDDKNVNPNFVLYYDKLTSAEGPIPQRDNATTPGNMTT